MPEKWWNSGKIHVSSTTFINHTKEGAYGKAGNGNWKWKPEMEIGNGN